MLSSVSQFMRDVVCEIVQRDLELLTLKYLQKTRKVNKAIHFPSTFFVGLLAVSELAVASGIVTSRESHIMVLVRFQWMKSVQKRLLTAKSDTLQNNIA